MRRRRSTDKTTTGRALALIAVALLVPLFAILPASAGPGEGVGTGAPTVYDLRVEAAGASVVYDDDAFLFPYADPALPHTEGSLTSPGDAAGFAAVFDPGTAVTGLPNLVATAQPGAPAIPPYPGAVQTRAGSTQDASTPGAVAGPDAAAVAGQATSHSDPHHTEQQASVARVTFPESQRAVLTVQKATAYTLGRLAEDGILKAVSEVALAHLSLAQVQIASLQSHVAVTVAPGGTPVVERSLTVTGLAVGGRQLVIDERGEVVPGVSEHQAAVDQARQAAVQATGGAAQVAVIQGREITADGTVTTSSDTLRIDVPVPGTLQTVTVLVGTAAVKLTAAGLSTPTGTAPAALLSPGSTSVATPPGPVAAPFPVTPPPSLPPAAEVPLPPVHPGPAPQLPAAAPAATRPGLRAAPAPAAALVRRVDRTWLVLLYLLWLCLSAAIVTAAAKTVLAAADLTPRTELFD